MPNRYNSGQVTSWGSDGLVVQPSPIRRTGSQGWLGAATTTAAGLIQENGIFNGSAVFLPSGVLEEIAIRVTVVGSSGALIRLGVYSIVDTSLNLVWDAGTIDGTSATTQSITGGTMKILAGWYLLGAACQGSPSTRPTINRNTGLAPYTWVSQTTADSQLAFPAGTGIQIGSVTGALPSTATMEIDGSRSQVAARVVVKGSWT